MAAGQCHRHAVQSVSWLTALQQNRSTGRSSIPPFTPQPAANVNVFEAVGDSVQATPRWLRRRADHEAKLAGV